MKAGGKSLYLLPILLLLTACSLPGQHASAPAKQIHINGVIFGKSIAAAKAGLIAQPLRIAAHVRCNEGKTVADADGRYSLAVRQANTYRCTISYPGYVDGKALINAAAPQHDIELNVGPIATTLCDSGAPSAVITCSPLAPMPGSLMGTVTLADTHSPLANATVECWPNVDQPQPTKRMLATTDAQGRYAIPSAAMGPDACVILGKDEIYYAQVSSGKTTTLNIQVCQSKCGSFHYHGGSVMESYSAYVIFWLPPNHTYEPYGSNTRFESLITRYFRDVGGTPLYDLLTQYWGNQGQIHNHADLGGVYRDTRPYPSQGTRAHPLNDNDITDEIGHVMKLTGWSESSTHEFFVFTGFGVQECFLPNHSYGCTFYTGHDDFCGYHTHTGTLIYAYISVSNSCFPLPGRSPNGDEIADMTISLVSHEQFESVTDPLLDGWFGKTSHDDEVADLCLHHYGSIRSDGSNVTLNHGHRYIVQEEWSRQAGRCALS